MHFLSNGSTPVLGEHIPSRTFRQMRHSGGTENVFLAIYMLYAIHRFSQPEGTEKKENAS
jgi:hypothetical protein